MPQKILYAEFSEKPMTLTDQMRSKLFPELTWKETHGTFDTSALPTLIISKLDKNIGHGVRAGQAIQKGDLVCLYTGELTKEKSLYNFPAIPAEEANALLAKGIMPPILDAEKVGGVGRFIQDLPDHEQLENYQFTSTKMHDQVATSNLDVVFIGIDGKKYPIFIATRDIKEGEQLGYPYGKKYWRESGQEPEIFDCEGRIIDRSNYQFKLITLLVHNKSDINDINMLEVSPKKLQLFCKENISITVGPSNDAFVVCSEIVLKALSENKQTLHLTGVALKRAKETIVAQSGAGKMMQCSLLRFFSKEPNASGMSQEMVDQSNRIVSSLSRIIRQ